MRNAPYRVGTDRNGRPGSGHRLAGTPVQTIALAWALTLSTLALSCTGEDAAAPARGNRPLLVETTEVGTRDVTVTVNAVGTVYASSQADVRPQVDGILERVDFVEGQAVTQGQVLAVLDSRKSAARVDLARAQMDSAAARLKVARSRLGRAHELARGELLSEEALENLEAEALEAAALLREREAGLRLAERELEDFTLLAPFDGVAGLLRVDVGNYMERGTVLTNVLDATPVEVLFSVPSRNLPQVAVHQVVVLLLQSGV